MRTGKSPVGPENNRFRTPPRKGEKTTRKLPAAVIALGVTGVTLAGLAGAASATHPGAANSGAIRAAADGIIKQPTTSYTSPTNQSIPVHTLHPDTAVTTGFTEGQTINNNFYWFRILHKGDLGFVHRDAIVPPTELRHC